MVYDSVLDRFHVNNPFIRTCRHVPWQFFQENLDNPGDVWEAPNNVKGDLIRVLNGIFEYWLQGGKSLSENPFGLSLADGLLKIVTSEHCKVWQLVMPAFDDNLDETLWYLLHFTADVFAYERRTEWRYFHGPGSSGKDTLSLLSIAFLGDRADNGYACLFEPGYFVGSSKKTVLDPMLDTARSMRVIVCNEVPEHTYWDFDRVKALVEPRGTGVVTRTIYAKPERWSPCAGLQVLSNHKLQISEKQALDTGTIRRLNVLELKHVFPEKAAKDVKEEVNSKKYNKELFWLARIFMSYLKRLPANATRITPIPPRVLEETETALTLNTRLRPLKDFMEDRCAPVLRYADATPASEIKRELASLLGLPFVHHGRNEKLEAAMKEDGIEETCCGSKRVLMHQFPLKARKLACRLNPPVAAEGPAAAHVPVAADGTDL